MADSDVAMALILANQRNRWQMKRRMRRYWVRPWFWGDDPLLGQYERPMADLRKEDVSAFRNFVRMDPEMFWELLRRLGLRLTKNDT